TLGNGTSLQSPIDIQGTVRVLGSVALNGALSTGPGSTLRMVGVNAFISSTLTVANGFTNQGAIELVDSTTTACCSIPTLNVTNGTLVNAAGATITAMPSAVFGTGRVLSAALDNQGTLTVNVNNGLSLGHAGA